MNINKIRKLFRHPKQFLHDSTYFNKLLIMKNKVTLGFIIIGDNEELVQLTLNSLKAAANVAKSKSLNYKIINLATSETRTYDNPHKTINQCIKELNSDFVKIIFEGEKVNNNFIKLFNYNERIVKNTNVVITSRSTESNSTKTDSLITSLKIKSPYGSLSHSNNTIYIPLLSNLIFNCTLFKNIQLDNIENNLLWNIMCCVRAIDSIPNNLSYVHIKDAYTFPQQDSSLDVIISELTKNEQHILPLLTALNTYLYENNIGIITRRSIFYFVHCIVLSFLKNKKAEEILSIEAKEKVLTVIISIVNKIGVEIVKNIPSSNYNHIHKIGYHLLLNEIPPLNMCYIEDTDTSGKKIKIKIAASKDFTPLISVGETNVLPVSLKTRVYTLLGHVFSNEIYLWIPFENANQSLIIHGETKNEFLYAGKKTDSITINQAINSINNRNKVSQPLPLKVRILRKLARNKYVAKKFSNAWLLTDNEVRADDNAEHFYRYIANNHKDVNAFFLLNKDSCDWQRLKQQGFRLIKFGGLTHRLALLNSKMLLSSHANPAIINFLPRKHFSDMLNYKFAFLQHGITKDDQSEWLNSRKIDYLVTAAQHEYADIAENGRYRYTSTETVLTGFPRYDNLVQPELNHKTILILPTWRKSLAGELVSKTSIRAKNEFFNQSEFCKQWSQFLNSKELENLSIKHGYSVLFYPHPNLVDYLDDINIPEHVEVGIFGVESFQEVFKKASILITDFSSVAFDVAYMSKPIIYFQFDIDTFFSEHSYSKGYYEYPELGFGPVVHDIDSLNKELENSLENNCIVQDKYKERINTFFPFSDHSNSERLFKVLTKTRSVKPCLHTILTYIQYYNNKSQLAIVGKMLRENKNVILQSTNFYHYRIKRLLSEVSLISFIHENKELTSLVNSIRTSLFPQEFNQKLMGTELSIGHGYSTGEDDVVDKFMSLILNAEEGKSISYSFNDNHERTPAMNIVHHYLLLLACYQLKDFAQCINIYKKYFSESPKIRPKRVFLFYIRAMIKTSKIVDACNKIKNLPLIAGEKEEILSLLDENYKSENINTLLIPFLKPDIEFNVDAINAYFYLSKMIKPEEYVMYFKAGIHTKFMVENYVLQLYEKNQHSRIASLLSDRSVCDTFVTSERHKTIYLFSLFKKNGIEDFINEALRLTNTENVIDAINTIDFSSLKTIEQDILYCILEQILKNNCYTIPCVEVYKLSLIFYKYNRPGLAKKIITLSLVRQHEDHYIDAKNWRGNNDYKTLMLAIEEIDHILA